MKKKRAIIKILRQRDVADRCGVSPGRISQICKGTGWPHGSGPWSSSEADAVCAAINDARRGVNDPDSETLGKARITLMNRRISLLEFEIKRLNGGYIRMEDHKTAMIQSARTVCAWLDTIPNLAPEVSGVSPERAREILVEFVREMRAAVWAKNPLDNGITIKDKDTL